MSVIDVTSTQGSGSASSMAAARAVLEEQRQLRTAQLDELAADAAESANSGDDQRLQVTRVLRLAADAALSEIEAAMVRLDEGRYGSCERCAEPIPSERLEVLPTTALCTRCQHAVESGRANRGGLRRRY